MVSRHVDISLIPFLRGVTSIILKVFLVISILSMLGFNTASFITALGAAGLAIGLALQGSLSNFAGGVLILLFKPFKAGDFIEAQGHKGVVKEIQILYTILTTTDNKKVVIPNGNLSNKDVVNFSAEDIRRVDIKLPVSYTTDLQQAIGILKKITEEETLILKDPEPVIGVAELGSVTITLDFFFWVNRPDYITALHKTNANIKAIFEKAGIGLPAQLQPFQLSQGNK